MNHPLAEDGFNKDYNAMKWADTCVLVLPSGRSSHIEAGYFCGSNKKLIIYIPENEIVVQQELMYKMADNICTSIPELLSILKKYDDTKVFDKLTNKELIEDFFKYIKCLIDRIK